MQYLLHTIHYTILLFSTFIYLFIEKAILANTAWGIMHYWNHSTIYKDSGNAHCLSNSGESLSFIDREIICVPFTKNYNKHHRNHNFRKTFSSS